MKLTLKDGSVKEYQGPVTAAEAAKDLSMGLYRAACAVGGAPPSTCCDIVPRVPLSGPFVNRPGREERGFFLSRRHRWI